jgi:hypothetical protein
MSDSQRLEEKLNFHARRFAISVLHELEAIGSQVKRQAAENLREMKKPKEPPKT